MLTLDDFRAEFARKLSENPAQRCAMDKALSHVITLAYELGIKDGASSIVNREMLQQR
jgi:hypothetical protein